MMRGFSLLEFLVGSTMFLWMILAGYRFLQEEQHLTRRLTALTRPEIESNYRQLVVRTSLAECTEGFRRDPLLSAAPFVFPDLSYGQNAGEHAFSAAHPISLPVRFVLEGTQLRIPQIVQIPPQGMLLLAGPDTAGNYTWDYVRVTNSVVVGTEVFVQFTSLTGREPPVYGSLVQVEMVGLDYRNKTVYWVHPTGGNSAFLAADAFQSNWDGRFLNLRWQVGSIGSEFRVKP